ncbi:MAG: hypothetical protein PHW63_10050 [Alphaproteobacteria bacterium]|nr:hypothetical protein [Alphaproteobacteria bacterium]
MSDKVQEEKREPPQKGRTKRQKKQRTLEVIVSKPQTEVECAFAAAAPVFLGRAADIQKDLLPLRRSMRTRYALNILRCVSLAAIGRFNPDGFVLRKQSDKKLGAGYVVYEKWDYSDYRNSGWQNRCKPVPILELRLLPQKKALGIVSVKRTLSHEVVARDEIGLLQDDKASVLDDIQLVNLFRMAASAIEPVFNKKACLWTTTMEPHGSNTKGEEDERRIENFLLKADAIADRIQPHRQRIYIKYACDLTAAACDTVVSGQDKTRSLVVRKHRLGPNVKEEILRGEGASVIESDRFLFGIRVWPTLHGVEVFGSQDETGQCVSRVLDIMDHTPAKLSREALLHLFKTVFCAVNKCVIDVDTPDEGTSIEEALPKGTVSLQKGLGSPYLSPKDFPPKMVKKKHTPAGAAP